MKRISTTRLGKLLGVSQTTIFRWAKKGQLVATETPGGHFRFDPQDPNNKAAYDFLRALGKWNRAKKKDKQ